MCPKHRAVIDSQADYRLIFRAEFANLKSQFATSSWGGTRKLPLAFAEHAAIMAATMAVHGSVEREGEVVYVIA